MHIYRLFKKEFGSKIYLLGVLGILSGICNMWIIKTITGLMGENYAEVEDIYYYAGLIIVYVIINRVFSLKMLHVGLKSIVLIRTALLKKVSDSSYRDFQKVGKDKIFTTLTADTNTLASAPGMIVGLINNIATLLAVFIYMIYVSPMAFLILLGLIAIVVVGYEYLVRSAKKEYKEARNTFDVFFHYLNNLLDGFRELSGSSVKKNQLLNEDLLPTIDKNYKHGLKGGQLFINANIASGALTYIAIGAFIFSMIFFMEEESSVLITYVMLMMYVIGPIAALQGAYQSYINLDIAAKKILLLLEGLKLNLDFLDIFEPKKEALPLPQNTFESLELRDIEFDYNSEETFHLGPINLRIERGNIVFLCGGNGSGKTSLMQLILGLYKPTNGKIVLNDNIDASDYMESYMDLFSVIYTDFYLFPKLYGVEEDLNKENAEDLFETMKLTDKVTLENNRYTTINLSQGQRRRLALITSLLENKEIFFFDEFAADQDPEFTHFFYTTLLPELKEKGKTVIAITHDDRYFSQCDHMIKMEKGKVSETALEMS